MSKRKARVSTEIHYVALNAAGGPVAEFVVSRDENDPKYWIVEDCVDPRNIQEVGRHSSRLAALASAKARASQYV